MSVREDIHVDIGKISTILTVSDSNRVLDTSDIIEIPDRTVKNRSVRYMYRIEDKIVIYKLTALTTSCRLMSPGKPDPNFFFHNTGRRRPILS
jgi:hypothetical protein